MTSIKQSRDENREVYLNHKRFYIKLDIDLSSLLTALREHHQQIVCLSNLDINTSTDLLVHLDNAVKVLQDYLY